MKYADKASILLLFIYFLAIVFFAVVRGFGILWFDVGDVILPEPHWSDFWILGLFWHFDFVVAYKTLMDFKIKPILLIVVISWALINTIHFVIPSNIFVFVAELFMLIGIPTLISKYRYKTMGYSVVFVLVVVAYQAMMIFGRGYPAVARMSVAWQMIVTADYRIFLLLILRVKGVISMKLNEIRNGLDVEPFTGGCFLLIGKFDNAMEKVGYVLLHPIQSVRGLFI